MSYSIIMILRHLNKKQLNDVNDKAFENLSKDEIKEVLSCVMNTSVEQIHNVYFASLHTYYSTQEVQFMHIFERLNNKL